MGRQMIEMEKNAGVVSVWIGDFFNRIVRPKK